MAEKTDDSFLNPSGDNPIISHLRARNGRRGGIPPARGPVDPDKFRGTEEEKRYWIKVFGEVKKEKPEPAKTQTEKNNTKEPQKKSEFSKGEISFPCGCPATLLHYSDGRNIIYPHHIKGCNGDEI